MGHVILNSGSCEGTEVPISDTAMKTASMFAVAAATAKL